MTRVEILYDFDFAAFEYYKKGLNHHPTMRFSGNKEIYYPLKGIKESNNIESLYLLGGGIDKISIIESNNNKCITLEPCSALFFICSMEEVFEFFVRKKRTGDKAIHDGGIYIFESLFRIERDMARGEAELHIGVSFDLKDYGWEISLGKIVNLVNEIIFKAPLASFLSSYLEFGERMIRFYDHVLPEYKEFKHLYPLFIKAVQNSVILEEFEVKLQSSYDGQTYYDFQ